MRLRRLPHVAQRLCDQLHAPHALLLHLMIVHDVANDLVEQLVLSFPGLTFDLEAVLFGASVHDLGKVIHQRELTGSGNAHERDGPPLLERLGVDPRLARFARTHGTWKDEPVEFEDVLVGLADQIWKGKRDDTLEQVAVELLVVRTGVEPWTAFQKLDDVLSRIGNAAERRLASS